MSIFFQDTFNGTAGTALEAHTPDSGGSWVKKFGASVLTAANTARDNGTSTFAFYVGSVPTPSTNYVVSADYIFKTIASYTSGIVVQYANQYSGNYYYRVACVGGILLIKGHDGASGETVIASTAFSPVLGSTHNFSVRVENGGTSTRIRVYLDGSGTAILDFTDSSSPLTVASAQVGLSWFDTAAPSDTVGLTIDNFIAQTLAVLAVSPSSVVANSTGNVLAVTGVNTAFSGSPFTISGIPGAAVTAQTVTDSTHASVTISAGITAGTLTLTDSGSGAIIPITVTATQSLIICKGDSLTYGTNASLGQGTMTGTCYPAVLIAALGSAWVGQNLGIPGETLTTMISARATEIDPLYDATKATNVIVVFGGTNDITQGTSAATTYARLVSYCQAIKAAHPWKLVVITPPTGAGIGGTLEPTMAAYNALVCAGWQTFADGLADIYPDSRLANSLNATYFATDKTHLTDAGYAVVGAYAAAAVQSALNYTAQFGGSGFLLSSPYSGGF